MPRPAVDPDTIKQIELIWAEDLGQSAVAVHRELERRTWPGYVGIRKVQEVVKRLRKGSGGEFEFTDWQPWVNPDETPEDTAYLLKLQAFLLQGFLHLKVRRGMWEYEAEWARRIHPSLEGLDDLHAQFFLVKCYAECDRIGQFIGRDPDTTIYDAKLMFREWTPEGKNRYDEAVRQNVVEFLPTNERLLDRTRDDRDFFLLCIGRYDAVVEEAKQAYETTESGQRE